MKVFVMFLGAIVWVCPILVQAAPPDPTASVDQIFQRQQQQEAARKKQSATNVFFGRPTGEKLDAKKKKSGKCFTIDTINLNGSELITERVKMRLFGNALGQCLYLQDINNIIKVVSNYYLDKGYITSRAFLTPQDITDGVLDVTVVEGKVDTVAVVQDDNAPGGRATTAFPGMEGEVLKLQDIEMGVEQMNRLQSQDANSNLLPSEKFAHTDLQVKNNQTRSYQFVITADNHGSENTGEYQLSTSLNLDNPLALNDKLIVNLNGTSKQSYNKATRGNSFSYQIPYGYTTLDFSYSKFDYRQEIAGLNEVFLSNGTSSTYSFGVDHIFHRDKDSKSRVNLAIGRKRNKNFIEDVLIDVSSRKLSTATLTLAHSKLFETGSMDVSVSRHEGIKWFHAEQNLGGDSPKAQFQKYTFDLSGVKQFQGFDKNWTLSSSVHAQESQDKLYGTEQMSIGGLYTVRGFDGFGIAGNRGWHWRTELSFETALGFLGKVFPFVAYDVGRIKSDQYGTVSGKLSGRTFGLRTQSDRFNLDMSWSRPNEHPDSYQSNNTVFSASLNLTF